MAKTSNCTKETAYAVWNVLLKTFPNASCTLDKDEPYRFLIRALLSAQCTDKKVNAVCKILFDELKTPEEIFGAGINVIEEYIKPCGLYHAKAGYILSATDLYLNEWGRKVPRDVNILMKCPGIGRKIANLLVGELYDVPALVVDTHFKRVAYRIGLTKNHEPLKVEKDVCKLFDENKWNSLGHRMVAFGREYCVSQNPKCDECPISKCCGRNL